MSITYNSTITPASFTPKNACYDPVTNTAYIVESAKPSFQAWNLALNTLLCSGTTISSPSAIALINTASGVIVNGTSTSTSNFVELSTGYLTTVSIANSNTLSQFGQYIAGDTSLGVAFSATSTARRIIKYTAVGQTATGITLNTASQFVPHCVILRTSGRWLIGGPLGRILEIDVNGNIVDELIATLSPETGLLTDYTNGALSNATVCSMSIDGTMLLVGVGAYLMLFDYSTKTKLWQQAVGLGQGNDSILLSNSSSGVCLMTNMGNTSVVNNSIKEIDFTTSNVQVKDNLFTNSTAPMNAVVLHTALNSAFALQTTNNAIVNLGITPRSSILRTFTVNPGGVHQQFRLVLLDDTTNPGIGPCTRVLDTYAQSPATYRIVPGKSYLELIKVGNGNAATWDYSEYST